MPDLRQEAKDFLHDCDRSARYHTARSAFFNAVHRWMMVAVLVSGSSAVATLAAGVDEAGTASGFLVEAMLIMLLPTLFGAISAVWNLSDKARDHALLARRFREVEASIKLDESNPDRIEEWRVEILRVYGDEPAVYHALNAECGNAASQALGYGPAHFQRVDWKQHMLRNLIRFSPHDFPRGNDTVPSH